ncbi:HEAT repeat domain-containing protein [Sporosalibacterium faouarense]|uniref:HEAT repeat domain-containing protein n=1 Tax=Sporosalibacterium faouarense TaxID=516123 RepID=UPI00192B9EC7|nr:HEAT repeat domain-containing protein [Sporosalibacterium faouarense]
MKECELKWSNINNLDDKFISYLLYLEGKSISQIALIRRIDKAVVEKQIIDSKILMKSNQPKDKEEDILIKIISLNKDERKDFLNQLNEEMKGILEKNIYKRYTKFKNPDDKMLLLWTIGELRFKSLLPLLRMELKNNNVNLRRLSCSALGKLKAKESKLWLEKAISDENSQVRQYAIKALAHIGDLNTLKLLKEIQFRRSEKDYVKRAALQAIDQIQNSNY